jgi:group I intron endonuclease
MTDIEEVEPTVQVLEHTSCGIYQIRNKVSGLIYIGQSSKINSRWIGHRHLLRTQSDRLNRGEEPSKRCNRHLLYSWAKYGEDAFEFTVLENCALSDLTAREKFWIDDARTKGIILANTAGPCDNPMRGQKHTAEALAKISLAASKLVKTDEHKRKIGLAQIGKIVSEESKRRLSIARTGIRVPKMCGDNNPSRRPGARDKFKGSSNPVHNPGVKEKISISNSKAIMDIDSGEVWPSSTLAATALGVSVAAVSNAALGKAKTCKGRRLRYGQH